MLVQSSSMATKTRTHHRHIKPDFTCPADVALSYWFLFLVTANIQFNIVLYKVKGCSMDNPSYTQKRAEWIMFN